jgi:hypothetical protein
MKYALMEIRSKITQPSPPPPTGGRERRQLAGASDPENFTGNQDFYLTAEASSPERMFDDA